MPDRIATSINGVPVRLTDERWQHIRDEHGELSFGDPRAAIAFDVDGVLMRYTEDTGEIVGITIIGVGDMLKKKRSPGRAEAAPPK